MPIPDFDHNHVLPPHLGDPRIRLNVSPYECTTLELCEKFSTSIVRIDLLKKFIEFRSRMRDVGLNYGFQWIDGSFLENIEKSESRDPKDIDVVTFFGNLTIPEQHAVNAAFPEFFSPSLAKMRYKVDHYPVHYDYDPGFTVESARYWIQLFTHKRNGVWKGILKIPLNTMYEDDKALLYLNSL
ncbi:hypothetical protein J2799_001500 [Chryseobacterium vietnamense]|uniref:DUF6932 family protein n=1 Tax=Chryseobacterium vietnamense TaxID=866785 RepID=UPI002863CC49|nr:hypothetical protein [Chryseobacterium vietnamense]MDR6487015.1 hypothetical protein [Chryseobacterium vietnamense]